MDQLARDYADSVHFLFVYVREAHPDDFPDHPAHKSIEQKYQHARDMRDRHNTPRQILIDDLDGAVHREWSGLPNMSWIIDHTGQIVYKAGWTVEADIREALEETSRLREIKRQATEQGTRYRPYFKETFSGIARKPRQSEQAQSSKAAASVGDDV